MYQIFHKRTYSRGGRYSPDQIGVQVMVERDWQFFGEVLNIVHINPINSKHRPSIVTDIKVPLEALPCLIDSLQKIVEANK